MTNEMMNVRSLVEKRADADLLRDMIDFAAERLMELEVGSPKGADFGEKNPMRLGQHRGYKDRDWETRAGTFELRISKLRKGSYFPSFLEPRRIAEKALTADYSGGIYPRVSSRSVDDLVKAMGMSGISKSQVSRLCEEIDVKVKAFLDWAIEGEWSYVWVDATYLEFRRGDLSFLCPLSSPSALTAMVDARYWVRKSARRKPNRSGWSPCAGSRGEVCTA